MIRHVNTIRFTDTLWKQTLTLVHAGKGYLDMTVHVLSRPIARPRRRPAGGWLGWLAAMFHAIETRHQLAEMDDRMLKDVGISRAEAYREAERAPWDMTPRASWDMR
jgi:uncharacterized protein YjiS (DUF1127 family)